MLLVAEVEYFLWYKLVYFIPDGIITTCSSSIFSFEEVKTSPQSQKWSSSVLRYSTQILYNETISFNIACWGIFTKCFYFVSPVSSNLIYHWNLRRIILKNILFASKVLALPFRFFESSCHLRQILYILFNTILMALKGTHLRPIQQSKTT